MAQKELQPAEIAALNLELRKKTEFVPDQQQTLQNLVDIMDRFPLFRAVEEHFDPSLVQMPEGVLLTQYGNSDKEEYNHSTSAPNLSGIAPGCTILRLYSSPSAVFAGQDHLRQVSFSYYPQLQDLIHTRQSGKFSHSNVPVAVGCRLGGGEKDQLADIQIGSQWPYIGADPILEFRLVSVAKRISWEIWDRELVSNFGGVFRMPTPEEANKLVLETDGKNVLVGVAADHLPVAKGFELMIPVAYVSSLDDVQIQRRTHYEQLRVQRDSISI